MWTFDEFKEKIVDKLKKQLGDGYTISSNALNKINHGKKEGIQILKDNHIMSVQIYLEPFYSEYCKTEHIDSVIQNMMEEYKNRIAEDCQISLDNPAKQITYRLIHYQANKELLQRIPHIRYEDLAIVFAVILGIHQEEVQSFLVNYDHMREWNMMLEEVSAFAKENTPRIFPAEITALRQNDKQGKEEEPIFLFSNEQRVYGTGIILYEHILQDFADRYGWNLFLLPTSVHEFLVVFDKEGVSPEELLEIVQNSNKTIIQKKDFLSNNLYYYDRNRKEFYGIY